MRPRNRFAVSRVKYPRIRRRNRRTPRDRMGNLINFANALRSPQERAVMRMARSSRLRAGLAGLVGRARARIAAARRAGVPRSSVYTFGRRMR